ncbi:hypothetical protein SLEP1_g48077 [Rubroshorea leprosula]|uniref:Uncharacterized protein n=1 Tax=Rubroshorea leprosula TaxID=152421 RepID=A0AAV5LSI1_9ROSI|nr:hypothetical protein SLEP1_g48077 [Rubroshorea leprosula]
MDGVRGGTTTNKKSQVEGRRFGSLESRGTTTNMTLVEGQERIKY